jgi:hypothetical protein
MAGLLFAGLIDIILDWLAKTIVHALDVLWDLLSATIFQSPDVTKLPQVTRFAGTSLGIVNVCYVLAILAMAIMVMGRDTIQSRYGPSELIPRLIIGVIAANFAIPLCSTVIGLANALTTALTSQDITAPGSIQLLRTTMNGSLVVGNPATPENFLLIVIGLFIAVLVAMLVVQWIIRLGVLVVAVGISPIALALHGTPQTEGAAKLWWRTFLGTLGTVVIQAVGLHTALSIFLSPKDNLPVLGLPGDPGAVMNLFVVASMLVGVLNVSGYMRRYITQSRSGVGSQIFRLVVIQQLTKGLSRAVSGRGTAARASNGRGSTGPSPRQGGPVVRPTGGTRALARSTRGTNRPGFAVPPLPPPSGAGPGRVGVAYPTGRRIRPYTPEELAGGVDVYTRALKARAAARGNQGRKP